MRASAALTALAVTGMVVAPAASGATTGEVPPASDSTSVVTVKTGGDREGANEVGPLPGVRLGLFAAENDAEPINDSWAVCVADADGDCSFVVPETDGDNAAARYWVGQIDAPDGWFTNPTLRTGHGNGSDSEATPYRFPTPELEANEVYTSTEDFMIGTARGERRASGGVWQSSRDNPPIPQQCGLDVAVVLDLSSSVGSSLPDLKRATDTFADSLVGTPSRMSLFSFDRSSPSAGADANYPNPRSVSTQAGADDFKELYADWGLGSGTSWDRGIAAAWEAEQSYDLAVVITDGNPTYYGDPPEGAGSRTRFREVENGIFSANALKGEGTRLLAVGVGSGVDEITERNLRALSGPQEYDGENELAADYFRADDFDAVGRALNELATSRCMGSLTVVKQVVPGENSGEDISGAGPAGEGWTFDASSPDDLEGLPASETTTDEGTGAVNFPVTHPPDTPEGTVTVREEQRPGFEIVTQDGKNAVCTNLDDDTEVPTANDDSDPEHPGFSLDMEAGAAVSCTIYNRPPPSAEVTVEKKWDVDGTHYDHGDQPEVLDADLTLTGPDDEPTGQPWGETRTGYTQGDAVGIDESVRITDPTCELTGRRVTDANGEAVDEDVPYETDLERGANTFTITNTVTCAPPPEDTTLTLRKEVRNEHGGDATPDQWTLSASGPDEISGTSGDEAVTEAPVEPGDYTLTESDGPEGYEADGWECVTDDGSGREVSDGVVTLTEGDDVTCTVVNQDTEQPTEPPTEEPTEPPTPGPGEEPGQDGHEPRDESTVRDVLPTTGAAIWGLLGAAVLLLGAGTALYYWARRRRFGFE